jgi:hypothetical protein
MLALGKGDLYSVPALGSLRTVVTSMHAEDDEVEQLVGSNVLRVRARQKKHLATVVARGTYQNWRSELEIRESPNLARDEDSSGNPSQRSSVSSALLGGLPELLKQDEFAGMFVSRSARMESLQAGLIREASCGWTAVPVSL